MICELIIDLVFGFCAWLYLISNGRINCRSTSISIKFLIKNLKKNTKCQQPHNNPKQNPPYPHSSVLETQK